MTASFDYAQLLKLIVEHPEFQKFIEDKQTLQRLKDALQLGVAGIAWVGAYSTFLLVWAGFELLIEILIMRALRLTPQETSILCGSLNFGAKVNIAYSLLARDEANAEGLSLLKKAHNVADRNSFAHGFLFSDRVEDGNYLVPKLVKRDIKDKYRVIAKPLGADEILKHSSDFMQRVNDALTHFKVTPEDMQAYQKSIADEASTPARGGKPHLESPTNSPTSSRKEPP